MLKASTETAHSSRTDKSTNKNEVQSPQKLPSKPDSCNLSPTPCVRGVRGVGGVGGVGGVRGVRVSEVSEVSEVSGVFPLED